jgi:hypothetical protein
VWFVFSFFRPARFVSVQLASSLLFLLTDAASPPADVATPTCHVTYFPWSQDKFATSASSSGNASFHRFPSWAKIEALNLHRRHRPPTLGRSTLILHCYKNVISTLVTLPTTQSRLPFASSIARSQRHRSSIRRYRFLSPPSHVIVPPHNDIHSDDLADHISLLEQFISMWIHVKW